MSVRVLQDSGRARRAAEQGYRVVEGHRLEEPRVGALNGGNRAWGQAGAGDAQSFGAGVGRVDCTLDESFVFAKVGGDSRVRADHCTGQDDDTGALRPDGAPGRRRRST
ncbi:hypothetical protein ACFYOR_31310 [Streptomyces griseofuscus]|uniref:hypothetical protein n=1 Tax=Streptomyces TaxID=1883 RepID=UPI0018F070E0|nr:hypothetical protein [Streptomyces sp. CRPSP2-6A1]MBJ6998569.1 hypothetical protein [Streptomyces sp. CRPSP2-6A1]